MDRETQQIKEWLDKRFSQGIKDGRYFAHQPIYGYGKGLTEGRTLIRYARNLSILIKISQFKFNNFIDIGGAEGYMANLVKNIFNVDTYSCDLSYEANLRSRELFGLDSVGIDLANLPFENNAFDIVLCSEVLEHVTKPIQAICELKRITKKRLFITTEAICYDRLERKLKMLLVDLSESHADINWFLIDDFIFLLGANISYENTITNEGLVQQKKYSLDEVKDIIKNCCRTKSFSRDNIGISILFSKNSNEQLKTTNAIVDNLIDIMLNTVVSTYYKATRGMYLTDKLLNILCCPKCLAQIKKGTNELVCLACNKKYNVVQGIPLMYTNEDDNEYLTQKWRNTFAGEFGYNNITFMQLTKIFEHPRVKLSTLTKRLVKRGLKIIKFFNHANKILRKKSIANLFIYYFISTKKRTMKEMNRIINRFRNNHVPNFHIGDLVVFSKDTIVKGKRKGIIRKGEFGKIIDVSNDCVSVKVEGMDSIIYLGGNHRNKFRCVEIIREAQ